jgi:hypothetical protein
LRHPYTIINLIFAGIIGVIFLYSGIFSSAEDNHPVPCVHKQVTGEECKTCGFSNAFSELVRGNFSEARSFNPIAPQVFIFFLLQFLMRGFFLLMSFKFQESLKGIILADLIFSSVLFLWTFRQLLVFW